MPEEPVALHLSTAAKRALWTLVVLTWIAAGVVGVWRYYHLYLAETAEQTPPAVATLPSELSYADLTGSAFAPPPADPTAAPLVRELTVPSFPGGYAIWGATGRDPRGHLWFAVSAHGVQTPSAHLFELAPETGKVIDRGDVVSQLKRTGFWRPGEGQMKIHSKIVPGGDGYLYFASTDEQGERQDGSRLPLWGSHFWRLRLADNQWEHLFASPYAMIAVAGVGRYMYALGYFDHMLYQFDTQTQKVRYGKIGAEGGHISRNFLADHRGHVYVPHVRRESDGASGASVTLIELNSNLQPVGQTPLTDYMRPGVFDASVHGITGVVYMADRSMMFTTHLGRLYRIIPSEDDSPAQVESLGWFHPEGSAYAPSLFTYEGRRFVAGVVKAHNRPYQWAVYDLQTGAQAVADLRIPGFQAPGGAPRDGLLLYGSISRDEQGRFYVVGRHTRAGRSQPILLQLTPMP